MNEKALQLIDCSFRYSDTDDYILKNCSLELHYGEFMVLSGPSGEGKSTLLSLLTGIIPGIIPGSPEGEIFVAGKNIKGLSVPEISRYLGCVLQNADSQIVHDIIEDEIAFGCENLKCAPAEISRRIDFACHKMQLQKDWKTRTLSGGQKQRLTAASTLAMEQKILIFDEPLANLDLEGSYILLKTLKELTTLGYACLFIEHRLDVVLPYCDTVIWLEKQKLTRLENKEQALEHNMNLIPDTSNSLACREECISLDHISFTVSGRNIIKDFSLSIKKGERIVILGENGCGKSTLLRIIGRLLKPTTGRIKQNILPGQNRKPNAKWFQTVGYVYQNPSYQLFLSQVKDEISYRAADEAVAYCMEKFQLDAIAGMHPHALSEGQKRRVSIAAIAAGTPDVLLLDEPTVGQDYDNLKRMVDALSEIHQRTGSTMITITHDYRCASAFADRAIWMQDGGIYREGGKELIDEYFRRNITE